MDANSSVSAQLRALKSAASVSTSRAHAEKVLGCPQKSFPFCPPLNYIQFLTTTASLATLQAPSCHCRECRLTQSPSVSECAPNLPSALSVRRSFFCPAVTGCSAPASRSHSCARRFPAPALRRPAAASEANLFQSIASRSLPIPSQRRPHLGNALWLSTSAIRPTAAPLTAPAFCRAPSASIACSI